MLFTEHVAQKYVDLLRAHSEHTEAPPPEY